jgi:hypothetical protein
MNPCEHPPVRPEASIREQRAVVWASSELARSLADALQRVSARYRPAAQRCVANDEFAFAVERVAGFSLCTGETIVVRRPPRTSSHLIRRSHRQETRRNK